MVEAKVTISGPIVADGSEVDYCYPYTTLEDVQGQLSWQGQYDTVRVIINSPGGRCDKGLGIYDWLRALPNVTIITEAIGQCSSIATVVFLAGSERHIHPHTECLVHLPTGGISGANAEQAQTWADQLANYEASVLAIYAERAGVDPTTFADVMRANTTLTGQQMLDYGFATLLVEPVTALALMPTTATNSPAADVDEQAPSWAKSLMSKFTQALGLMTAAIGAKATPATNQATVDAPKALDVTTTGGDALTIDTGDRDTYEVGDAVSASDGTAAADGDYALSDGNTISVAAGAITVITPPATDDASANAGAGETDSAILQMAEGITALAQRMTVMESRITAATNTANRVAAATGSKAAPTRALASNDEDKDAPQDPALAAAEKRRAKREAKYKGN